MFRVPIVIPIGREFQRDFIFAIVQHSSLRAEKVAFPRNGIIFFCFIFTELENSKLRLFRTWSRVREEISKQLSDELFVINYILDPWVIFRNNASVVANVGSRCELSSLLGERIKRKSPTFGVGSGIKIFLAELSRLVSCLLAPGYLWRYPSGGIGNGL